jgi:hypothetical protein
MGSSSADFSDPSEEDLWETYRRDSDSLGPIHQKSYLFFHHRIGHISRGPDFVGCQTGRI